MTPLTLSTCNCTLLSYTFIPCVDRELGREWLARDDGDTTPACPTQLRFSLDPCATGTPTTLLPLYLLYMDERAGSLTRLSIQSTAHQKWVFLFSVGLIGFECLVPSTGVLHFHDRPVHLRGVYARRRPSGALIDPPRETSSMSSTLNSSFSLTATMSAETSGSALEHGGPAANWVVLFALVAVLVPFLLVAGGVACVSLRRSIRRARVRNLKTAIDGDGPGGTGSAAAARSSSRAPGTMNAKGTPGRETTTTTTTTMTASPFGVYPVVIGEPLRRNGSELRRASLESVDIGIETGPDATGGGAGAPGHGQDSPPAYRTTPARTPTGRAM